MKTLMLGALVMSFIVRADAQLEKSDFAWTKFWLGGGYAISGLGDVRDYYEATLNKYQSLGVGIGQQTNFRPTLQLDGGVLWHSPKFKGWIGLSCSYLFSPASSSYQDINGSLKVSGAVKTFMVCATYEISLARVDDYDVFFRIRPGLTSVSVKIREEVAYNAFPELGYYREYAADGVRFGGAFGLGISMPMDPLVLTLYGEYHLIIGGGLQGSVESNVLTLTYPTLVMDVDHSGPALQFQVGYVF